MGSIGYSGNCNSRRRNKFLDVKGEILGGEIFLPVPTIFNQAIDIILFLFFGSLVGFPDNNILV